MILSLLPFGSARSEQRTVANVRGLLDTVLGLSPEETIAKLSSSVLPVVREQPNLTMRFRLLEDIRQEAEQTLPLVEASITHATLPLPVAIKTAALHADNLLKGLSVTYASIARSIEKQPFKPALSQLFHRSIQRAMAMIARRQLLAYRGYTLPSPNSWLKLHELYQMTRGPLAK